MEDHGDLVSAGSSWSQRQVGTPDRPLRVLASHDPPYLYVHQLQNGSYHYEGYLFQLWEAITSELNLSYVMQPVVDLGYGSVTENGTWTGVVGELAYGRADVALTWLKMRSDRKTVIDFMDAVPVAFDAATFYIRQGSKTIPEMTPSIFSALLKPLSADVWWIILAFLFAMSVALRVTVRFNHPRAEDRRTVSEMTWSSCLLSSFMALVNQGWASTPSSLAARVVTVSCWVLSILIYAIYTANLISYLTVTKVDRPITSLREFVEEPGWLFAIEPGYANLNDWKASGDQYERELYRRAATGDSYIRLELSGPTGRRTTEPYVMTFVDLDRLLFSQGPEACHLVPLFGRQPTRNPQYLAIAQDLGQTKRAINTLMLRMLESGVVSRLQNYWLTAAKDICRSTATFKEMSTQAMVSAMESHRFASGQYR
ncbi:glutamate receptor 2-like [Amphibalanus amphitrite]|uniref:glutamate receptor 2-like n=1 Tax=Amphibalanus amphitrite TaxID=1232801 RepID=UPI001C905DDF|nr:glutamate receptor 2-like [Amphibalanus amphitrite]